MKTTKAAAVALAMALSAGMALPTHAEEPWSFDKVFRMADRNKDSMVSKQEFLEAMATVYDSKMKEMKNDSKMVKGDAMTRYGLESVIAEIYKGA
jgi:hypothetical protein